MAKRSINSSRKSAKKTIQANPFAYHLSTSKKWDIVGKNGPKVTPRNTKLNKLAQRRQELLTKQIKKSHHGSIKVVRKAAKTASARATKAARFNLNDIDDEDEESNDDDLLKHRGRVLEDDEDFESEFDDDDLSSDVDQEEDGSEAEEEVDEEDAHFGNFDDEKNPEVKGKPSKAEVMREIIAKSKAAKAERQRQREANDALVQEVNADFDAIRSKLTTRNSEDEDEAKDKADPYELALRRLAMDRRVAPADDPAVQAERQARKEQEAKARMQGAQGKQDQEEGESQDTPNGQGGRIHVEMSANLEEFLMKPSADAAYAKITKAIRDHPQAAIALGRKCRNLLGQKDFVEDGKKLACLLLLIGRVFSTGDAHHLIATPAILAGSLYLHHSLTNLSADLERCRWSLAIAWILLQYQRDAHRWLPEVANWIVACCGKDSSPRPSTLPINTDQKLMENEPRDSSGNLTLKALMFGEDVLGFGRLFLHAKKLQRVMLTTYGLIEENRAVKPSAFLPDLSVIVRPAETAKIAVEADVLSTLPELCRACKVDIKQPRPTFALKNMAPLALPVLNPALEDSYLPPRLRKLRDENDPGWKRDEIQRLRKSVKQETKSLKRDIERDAKIMAGVAAGKAQAKDTAYRQKLAQIYGQIGNEGAEFKSKRRR